MKKKSRMGSGTPKGRAKKRSRKSRKTKIIYLSRHSIKDGPNSTVGPKGLALAMREGAKSTRLFSYAFHSPIIRTLQTLAAFILAGVCRPKLMPVVYGLGSEELLAKIMTRRVRRMVKQGATSFEAIRQCHRDQGRKFARTGLTTVHEMFSQMGHGTVAVATFHSPCIELLVWALLGFKRLPKKYASFGEMEGVVLEQDAEGNIRILDRITVEALG